jgi:hypothetical protein
MPGVHDFAIPCETAIFRDQLKHTWIENQIKNKSEEEVVFLWLGPRWPVLEREFPLRVQEAHQLAKDLETRFSPAQLVDRLAPLARLPDDTRSTIRQAVHAAYLDRSGIAALKQTLTEAVQVMREALDQFLDAWKQPVSDEAEQRVRESWRQLYHCAESLRNELDRLPGGVVLP